MKFLMFAKDVNFAIHFCTAVGPYPSGDLTETDEQLLKDLHPVVLSATKQEPLRVLMAQRPTSLVAALRLLKNWGDPAATHGERDLLHMKWFNAKWNPQGESLLEYSGKLRQMAVQLESFIHPSTLENQLKHKILHSLPQSYNLVASECKRESSYPTVESIIVRLEEFRLTNMNVDTDEKTRKAVKINLVEGESEKAEDDEKQEEWDEQMECEVINDDPDGWNDWCDEVNAFMAGANKGKNKGKGKGNGGGGTRFHGYCGQCGKFGHSQKYCWNNPANKNNDNNSQSSNQRPQSDPKKTKKGDKPKGKGGKKKSFQKGKGGKGKW